MAGKNDNLTPFKKGDEAARVSGRKGGIKSGEARRKQRDMKDTLKLFLAMGIKTGKQKDISTVKNIGDLKGLNITTQEAITFSLIKKAMGDGKDSVAAYKMIYEIMCSGNDITQLDTSIFDGMDLEDIKKLADQNVDLGEDDNEEE